MSQPDNDNTSLGPFDSEDRALQEACLLYFERHRRLYALPVGWTERCETYPNGARELILTNGQYHVILYPGDTDVEPRAYITCPDGPLPGEATLARFDEEVLVLFRHLFGDELNPEVAGWYVTEEGHADLTVICDHPTDPASPEPSDN
jgi:hypothetical protein